MFKRISVETPNYMFIPGANFTSPSLQLQFYVNFKKFERKLVIFAIKKSYI